ncbi:RAMP superfamily CRISPR-associated protein, partial [Clostridium perfringens]
LTNKNDLFKYLKGENKFEEKAIGTLKNIAFDSNDVTFVLEGNLKTPILIKGEGLMDADRPDGEHIKNINGDYIIPGSSLKGVLRAQGERILGYFNKSNFSKELFGSEDKDKKIASKLKCFDSVISNSKEGVYHRIKLDKLTGGVRKSALFDDKVVLGRVKLESKIKGNDEEIIDIGTALIALVYRD